ncbi:MAG: zinc ribbon domain-containing protein [Candidatus Hydrogenedentota bacterium]|nr:MAG: zinc ribbon domain-containing protein [Candidatus Hydrogenedentota bacterium]
MHEPGEEVQLSKLESIFVVGIIGCMLFATWELGHLMADKWFRAWVEQDPFVNRRIILYGIAFFMSIASVLVTTRFAFRFGRFGKTINRAFLWYGTLLLISTIAIFVFDCLPEVFAGFIGAGVFICAIYVLQKRYFTKERIIKNRLEKGKCYSCGANLQAGSIYCPSCGTEVGRKCSKCDSFMKLMDTYCSSCGQSSEAKAAADS